MSTEPLPTPPPFVLPDIKKSELEITFTRPNIVLAAAGETMQLQNGKSVQVVQQVEETFGYEVVTESPFKILSMSRVLFGGMAFNVLDENSVPKAVDYLARQGQRTMISFRCVHERGMSEQAGKPVYRTHRGFVILP